MNQREPTTLDPALAGVVVAVGGALAVQVNRSGARRRPWFPLGPRR
jgi:hypothetical protein